MRVIITYEELAANFRKVICAARYHNVLYDGALVDTSNALGLNNMTIDVDEGLPISECADLADTQPGGIVDIEQPAPV